MGSTDKKESEAAEASDDLSLKAPGKSAVSLGDWSGTRKISSLRDVLEAERAFVWADRIGVVACRHTRVQLGDPGQLPTLKWRTQFG